MLKLEQQFYQKDRTGIKCLILFKTPYVAFCACSHKCALALQKEPDRESIMPKYLNSLTISMADHNAVLQTNLYFQGQ
jgi:hypothetical protein